MAVWGRAITVLAILSALAGLTACEYADDGDPRPSAVASSSPPAVSALPESTPDPEQEKRTARMLEELNALLGASTGTALGIMGPIGDPNGAVKNGSGELPAAYSGSGMAEPGQYIVKVACVGDTEVRFAVHDGDGPSVAEKVGQPDSNWIPCGNVASVSRALKSGRVTVEIQGKKRGIEAVGGIHVVKATAKAAPKP